MQREMDWNRHAKIPTLFQSPVTPCAGLEIQRRMRNSQGKHGIFVRLQPGLKNKGRDLKGI